MYVYVYLYKIYIYLVNMFTKAVVGLFCVAVKLIYKLLWSVNTQHPSSPQVCKYIWISFVVVVIIVAIVVGVVAVGYGNRLHKLTMWWPEDMWVTVSFVYIHLHTGQWQSGGQKAGHSQQTRGWQQIPINQFIV